MQTRERAPCAVAFSKLETNIQLFKVQYDGFEQYLFSRAVNGGGNDRKVMALMASQQVGMRFQLSVARRSYGRRTDQ